MERTHPSSPGSKTPWGTNPEMESVEEGKGRLAGKALNVPFCKNSTWILTSTEGFRTNSATDGASTVRQREKGLDIRS